MDGHDVGDADEPCRADRSFIEKRGNGSHVRAIMRPRKCVQTVHSTSTLNEFILSIRNTEKQDESCKPGCSLMRMPFYGD